MTWILQSEWFENESKTGGLTLTLIGKGAEHLSATSRLAFTSITRIPPQTELSNAHFVARTANYHEIAPFEDLQAKEGDKENNLVWSLTIPTLSHQPNHYTDGPSCAYLIHETGEIEEVVCASLQPRQQTRQEATKDAPIDPPLPDGPMLGLLPMPEVARIEEWHQEAPKGFFLSDVSLCNQINDLIQRLFPKEQRCFFDQPSERLLEVNLGYYEQEEKDEQPEDPLPSSDEDHQEETSFLMDFSHDHILITTNEGEACLYALIALAQMRQTALKSDHFAFPASGMIIDSPRFSWRGMHLDVSRQVYETQDILNFLDILAWNRFNRLHLHLTDDEGWRLESKAYPRLSEVGAWRGHSLPLKPQHGSGPSRHGGFFRHDDILKIISHAQSLNIVVVPEIDIPGHCYAALMALPELLDPSALTGGASIQGYVNNALNPGLAATWRFLDTIFAEVADLFPSPWVHIGGDEVAEQAWSGSGAAMSWAKAKGLVDSDGKPDSASMQAVIMRHVETFLHKKGKIAIGWEEAANREGLSPHKSPIMAWMKAQSAIDLAQKGYQVILCPGEAYYLDMAQSHDWQEPGLSWAGISSAEQTYQFEPKLNGLSEKQLLGIQGCIWSENLTSRQRFNHMVFPRLSAIAESAWSDPEKKSWQSFKIRMAFMPSMPEKAHNTNGIKN
ncbi:MAG: family 20 glycosylhydrolase [Cohaesibacter sp.]|nr:family 20 glycosylhydrolase [Cohaesibacter sp.]